MVSNGYTLVAEEMSDFDAWFVSNELLSDDMPGSRAKQVSKTI